jgi:VanZ family protein
MSAPPVAPLAAREPPRAAHRFAALHHFPAPPVRAGMPVRYHGTSLPWHFNDARPDGLLSTRMKTDAESQAGLSVAMTLDPRLTIAVAGIVAVILYGSLFPFHFQAVEVPGGPLSALLSTWNIPDDRGDVVSNFLLYLPFGFFSVRALRKLRVPPCWVLAALITLTGFALSMCVEMMQFYVPGRDSAMADVYANTAGAFAGALAAAWLRRDLFPGSRVRVLRQEIVWRPFAILLIACWLGNRLFPYFPAGDFHAHWSSLRTLLTVPGPLDLYKQSVYWLAAAVMLDSLFAPMLKSAESARTVNLESTRSRIALAAMVVMIAAVAMARLFLIGGTVSSAEIAGPFIAILAWAAMSRLTRRAAIVAILFVVLAILQALDPFHFLAEPRQFGWIPFASFISGPREGGVRVFFEKAFTYGTLVWLPVRAGASFPIAAIAGTALVFCLRLAQVFLPGRSAEITDAVMVLMMAGLMALVREPRS